MPDTDPRVEAPAESGDVEVIVCELAMHNIGFMLAADTSEAQPLAFLVFRL